MRKIDYSKINLLGIRHKGRRMNKKITKSNSLINSSYRLSLNELRIVLFGLSAINPMDAEFPLEHSFTKNEIAEFYAIPKKDRGAFYRDIEKALTTQFWNREFTYYDQEREQNVSNRWLITIRHGGKNPRLSYVYNPEIKKELQKLSTRFTSYFLTNVANMKSPFSIRFYEISIMHLNASKLNQTMFKVEFDELKQKLAIEGKYARFANFKARVLDKAKDEINKFSDISFNFEVMKRGRLVTGIKFMVSIKKTPCKIAKMEAPDATHYRASLATLEKAKNIVLSAETGWDLYAIEEQFCDFIKQKGQPDNIDGAFIGFVKKKVVKPPR